MATRKGAPVAEQRDLFARGVAEAAPTLVLTAGGGREDLQERFAAFGVASLDEGDTQIGRAHV